MDEISNSYSIDGLTKSTTSVDTDSSDSEIKKANEDFEKNLENTKTTHLKNS